MQLMKPSSSLQTIRPQWLGILAVVTTAIVLRPAATSIGPILDELQGDLGVSAAVAGALTALPGLSFALVGLTANRLVAKFGPVSTLIQASLFITLGIAIRVLTGSWVFFLVFSFMALAGMAIGNILLPAFIKTAFPHSSARMSTVYTTFLAVGAILPTMLSSPLTSVGAQALGTTHGWRLSVGVWAALGAVSLLAWIAVRVKCSFPQGALVTQRSIPLRDLVKSPTTLGLTLFFGTQSMQAYIQFGWAAQMYRDGGLDQTASAMMVTIIALGGIPAGLFMPRVVARRKGLRPLVVFYSALLAVGYLGIAFAPTTLPWLWALALSISGFCFSTALALIIDRTRDPIVTGAVSAFVQPFGYLLAAIGPLLVGVAYQYLQDWRPILCILAATSLVMLAGGMVATRSRIIDDELYPPSDAPMSQ